MIRNYILLIFCLLFSFVSYGQIVTPTPGATISNNRKRAALIYQRLTGLKLGIDAPLLVQMEDRLDAGDPLGAAALVTGDNLTRIQGDAAFYNNTVRFMATKMSNREESIRAPLNDFVASMAGVIRDESDARELLYGNFFYAPLSTLRKADGEPLSAEYATSNAPYDELNTLISNKTTNLRDGIERISGQLLNDGANNVANPDPAGLITSRAFMEAHAIAGTNRRLVHYSFKQFLCIDMEGWATTDSPSNRVGLDVDRTPGGSPAVFENTCKGCHGNMDGLRGAFAHIHFDDQRIKHGLVMTGQDIGPADDADALTGPNRFPRARLNGVSYPGIASKFIRGSDVAPMGFITVDASWINTATRGANAAYFGWRSPVDENGNIKGYGVNQFGRMLSNSQAFSRCMVRQVYSQVCKRNVSTFELDTVRKIASDFESDNYNFKKLFQRVVTSDACIGK